MRYVPHMASTFKRGNTWSIQGYLGKDSAGKSRTIYRAGFATKRDAERAANALQKEIDLGLHPIDQDAADSVAAVADRWHIIKTPEWSPGTVRTHRSIIDVHIKPGIGHHRIDNITLSDIDGFYATLEVAASTTKRVHAALQSMFNQAIRWGLIVHNPTAGATLPRAENVRQVPPTPAEVAAIIGAVDSPRVALAFKIAATTGVRRGQLVGLRWCDIDFATRRVTFSRNIVDKGGRVLVDKDPKTGRAGTATLPRAVADELRAVRAAAAGFALSEGAGLADDAYVFSWLADGGAPWRPDYLSHQFAKARGRVGLGHVTLKNLRHFCATQALGSGTDVATVSGMLGHARTSTTLDIYAAAIPGRTDPVADMFDEMFS